jgi:CheY-like chemotaxis protein
LAYDHGATTDNLSFSSSSSSSVAIMDGLDCVQQYRDWEKYHRPWISQRIVGISAHATAADIEKGLKVGMDDYKNKPVTFKVLSELIKCDKQVEMSKQLDEIETRESLIRKADSDETSSGSKKAKTTPTGTIDGRAFTCLVISPRSEEEHLKLLKDAIKEMGWQSTVASTEAEAFTWLKMRMWDVVLVDETFASTIADFREWEAKKRKTCQERVTLMSESVDSAMATQTQVRIKKKDISHVLFFYFLMIHLTPAFPSASQRIRCVDWQANVP